MRPEDQLKLRIIGEFASWMIHMQQASEDYFNFQFKHTPIFINANGRDSLVQNFGWGEITSLLYTSEIVTIMPA